MSRETLLSGRTNAATQSEPIKNPIQKGKPMPKTVLYKTIVCRQWSTGKCSFGERCHFAHGESDQRSRSKPLETAGILKTTKVKPEQSRADESPNQVITKDCQVTFLERGQVYIHNLEHNKGEPAQEEVYPTTAAVKAKLLRDDKEKEWQEMGDKEAIKASRKRKPQEQEEHFDDCGSDCDPLRGVDEVTALATSPLLQDQVAASFYDDEHATGAASSAMHEIIDSAHLQRHL